MRWLLLPLAPALVAIFSIAIATSWLWWLFLLGIAGTVYLLAKPRPLIEYDDHKELSPKRFDQLIKEVSE